MYSLLPRHTLECIIVDTYSLLPRHTLKWISDYTLAQTSSHPLTSSVISLFFLTPKKHISNEESHQQDHERLFLPFAAFEACPTATRTRWLLGPDITARLVSAFVLSWLDYCNSVLAGLPQSTIASLQGVQNVAARLIMSLGSHDHITPTLRQLHWLPVKFRVTYKLCLLMHAVHVGRCPGHIADLVTQTYSLPGRDRLPSAAGKRFSCWLFITSSVRGLSLTTAR